MNFRLKPKRVVVALLVCGIILSGAIYIDHRGAQTGQLAVSQAAAKNLPKESPNVPQLFLAKGLLPPTNKWFSSLAFSNQDLPVYAYPMSFALTPNGYSISNPPVVSSSSAIFATHIADVSVSMNTPNHIVENYDDLSVTVENQNQQNQAVAETRITHGSPYVFTELKKATNLSITTVGLITNYKPNMYLITVGSRQYGVYTNAPTTVSGQAITINGQQGSELSIFSLPATSNKAIYFTDAAHPITSTSVSYQTNKTVDTTYTLHTKNGSTLFAVTPTMHVTGHTQEGSYETLLGKQFVLSGNSFTDVQAMPIMPSPELNLSKLTSSERANEIRLLTSDTNSLTFTATDTYFGGKQLYRAANLLEIAEELNQQKLANTIKTKLAARLSEWLDPTGGDTRSDLYFYYDPSYAGVVGVQASYGSNEFNDHDFHYGYFIYAAAILSQYDKSFYNQNQAMVNVLISDIASTEQTALFPKLRYFDAYVGHSWASGNGEFQDGNNQESSSEAINAWYAMYLWSQVSHNKPLQSESIWLYQHETTAAKTMWLSPPATQATIGQTYSYPNAGIIWGDKIDYSTFFSSRPQATLGIQLIPMSPGQAYLSQTNINANINSVAPNQAALEGQFQDYLIMYQALSNPGKALQEAQNISPQNLDNANSMTYLYAWLYSHQQ